MSIQSAALPPTATSSINSELSLNSSTSSKSNEVPSSASAKSWVYINGLGERNLNQVAESDVLSAIKFSPSGEYLAVGD